MLLSGTLDVTRTEPAPARAVRPDDPAAPLLAAAAAHGGLATGVTIPSGGYDAQAVHRLGEALGRTPDVMSWYVGFGEPPDLDTLDEVAATGALPMITWEPYRWTDGVDQPELSLARLAAGDYDEYVAEWAVALAAWDRPVLLRFAHEMNGDWYPWGAGVNGNRAGEYRAVWSRIHQVFAEHGADRVAWVWAPNVLFPGGAPLAGLYPGDDQVDVIGLDGYNWGTAAGDRRWASPGEVFGPSLTQLRLLSPGTPVLITETGSSPVGGDKAAWVGQLYRTMAGEPGVVGVVWFDIAKEVDWRVTAEPEVAAALRAAAS